MSISSYHTSGHFGKVIWGTSTASMWITEPLLFKESGRVYFYKMHKDGGVLRASPRRCFYGSERYSRFGSSLLITDVNDDGKDDIVIGSWKGKLTESGSVHILVET